jgi:hypothetical protein
MLRTLVVCVVLVLLIGCGDDTSPSSPGGPGSLGSLNIRITDSPFGAAKAVLITLSEVAVRKNDDWTILPFPDGSTATWMCDLKKLENDAQDLIASGAPDAGVYTFVRLRVQSARVFTQNSAQSPTPCAKTIAAPGGESFQVSVPESDGSDNGEFPVQSDRATTVLLDFDGESSLSEPSTNNYVLRPVIRLISVQ